MLTNDRDIISSVIIELTKHFTSLLASYKENNNLIQDNDIIDVKYDEKFDVFRVDLTKINYEYKNCIRNLFSKDRNKRDVKQIFSSNLKLYKMTESQFARFLMNKIYEELHITATAGIGTNLFLCKVALDLTTPTGKPVGF